MWRKIKSCSNPEITSKCAGIIFHFVTICISMLSVVTQFERFTQMFHHIVESKHSSKTSKKRRIDEMFFFVQTNIYYSCHALDNVAFPPNHYCQRDVKPSREKYGRIRLHSLTILLIYGIEAVFCTHTCMCIICGENGYQHISKKKIIPQNSVLVAVIWFQ